MLNVAITVFVLMILAAIIGFGELDESFIELLKLGGVVCALLFLVSLIFTLATGRSLHPPRVR